jgi:hypothetical protein
MQHNIYCLRSPAFGGLKDGRELKYSLFPEPAVFYYFGQRTLKEKLRETFGKTCIFAFLKDLLNF